MEEIKSQLYELDENLDNYLFYDKEELRKEILFTSGKEEGFAEGKQIGLAEGMCLGKSEIIKKMASSIGIEEIHKITGLSSEEINEIITNPNEKRKFDE